MPEGNDDQEKVTTEKWIDAAFKIPFAAFTICVIIVLLIWLRVLPEYHFGYFEGLSHIGGLFAGIVGTAVAFSALFLLVKSIAVQKEEMNRVIKQQQNSAFEASAAKMLERALSDLEQTLSKKVRLGRVAYIPARRSSPIPSSASNLPLIHYLKNIDKAHKEYYSEGAQRTPRPDFPYSIDHVLLRQHYPELVEDIENIAEFINRTLRVFNTMDKWKKDSPVHLFYYIQFEKYFKLLLYISGSSAVWFGVYEHLGQNHPGHLNPNRQTSTTATDRSGT